MGDTCGGVMECGVWGVIIMGLIPFEIMEEDVRVFN